MEKPIIWRIVSITSPICRNVIVHMSPVREKGIAVNVYTITGRWEKCPLAIFQKMWSVHTIDRFAGLWLFGSRDS